MSVCLDRNLNMSRTLANQPTSSRIPFYHHDCWLHWLKDYLCTVVGYWQWSTTSRSPSWSVWYLTAKKDVFWQFCCEFVGTGFNFHLTVHRFLQLMYCSWKCFSQREEFVDGSQFRLLTSFIYFSRRSPLVWGKWKDAIFWSSSVSFPVEQPKAAHLLGILFILYLVAHHKLKKKTFSNIIDLLYASSA